MIEKKYILGFLLIVLIGVGLLIGGVVHYSLQKNSDLIETQGYVVGVEIRSGKNGLEYRPFSLRYFVEEEGKYYDTAVLSWVPYIIHQGDTMTVWYEKGNPTHTVVSNPSRESLSFALMGFGGVLIVAGIAFTGKYLNDVKRGRK